MSKVRLVVTGHDSEGKAVVVSDSEIAPFQPKLVPGQEIAKLWGSDSTKRYPGDGRPTTYPKYFPPVGGFRFSILTVPPDSGTDLALEGAALEDAKNELESVVPGILEYFDFDHPDMHATPSVDCIVVIEGEVWLELDDGVTVVLREGDALVQNGTRHRWRNYGDTVARFVEVIIGADVIRSAQ